MLPFYVLYFERYFHTENQSILVRMDNILFHGMFSKENVIISPSSGGAPNYHPNSFHGPIEDRKANETRFAATGDVAR